jgi:gliding motility-associated-like protein
VYNNGLCSSTSASLTVNKIVPTILSEIVTKTYGDPDFSLSATSSSTGTFSYIVMDTGVASNTGTNSITITGVGTTTIKINQTADANFSTGSKTITLYVRKADPNIILSNIVTRTYGDPDFNLTASSSSTGIFSYVALDSSVASISGNTVSIAGAGTTTIIVSQVSNTFYNAASSSMTLIVYKADPIIDFPDVTKTFGDPDFSLSATSSSTGDFAYSIDDLRIASQVSSIGNTTTITNSISARASNYGTSTRPPLFISIEKAGSTSITAVQAEDNNYNSASASMNLSILKKDLSVSVWYPTSTITRTFGIPPFEILLPNVDLNYNGVFNFRSSDSSIASISSRTLTINSIGTVTLFADMAADGNYNEKTVTVTLVVKKANQSIIVEPFALVKPLKDFSSFTVSATSTSGAPVVISLDPGSAAILSGTVGNYSLTNINQTGLVTITFTTDPSAHPNYNSATVTLVIDVVKTNQNITVSPEPPKFIYFEENLTYKINAFSDSSLNVDYRITSGTNAILNGDTLEIHDIGELEVVISQSGNNSFNPAVSRSHIIKVLQGMTILSNFNIPDKLIIDDDFVITPPSSNRSGPIKYISSNPNIAEIDGDQIIIKGIGSCTISAIQTATPRFTSASISTIFIVNDTDCDSDGIGDTIDLDDDNDGISDNQEKINGTDPCALDTDNDFLSDGDEKDIGTDPLDNDSDNDGVIDGLDDFPLDPNESVDTDGDGIGDNSDDDANGDGFLDDEIFVSGLVTPGVRGNEATWKVMNIQNYPGSKVTIYDRNGLQVFKQINYKNDWAGTFKQTGDLLPAGSYYYIIEVSQNNKVIQGWLYLTY